MTRIKRILSMLLVLCTLLGLLPNTAFAIDDIPAFDDVKESDWFYDDVNYAHTHGLMNGTSATTFAPQATTTRAMIVTILHRLEGTPSASDARFSDVTSGQYFTNAVNWAAEQNIVNGYGNDRFGPNDDITREQIAAILYRYATYKKYDVTEKADCSKFSDADQIGSYAMDAMAWCNAKGLVNGLSDNKLAPKGNATRAQVAAILTRFCKSIMPSKTEKPQSNTYTVIFNLNYGENETYQTAKVEDGKTVAKPSDPDKDNYKFNGWYTEKSGGKSFDFDSAITEDITLYAKWSSASGSGGGGGGSGGGNSGGGSGGGNGNPSVIKLTNSDYNSDTKTIVTKKSEITIEGTAASSNTLKDISVTYGSYDKSDIAAEVTGLSSWKADIKVEIGSNPVKVTVSDDKGQKTNFEFIINRINEKIEYDNKVKLADEEDSETLSEGMIACWNDDNETLEDESDDKIVVLVKEDSLLLNQIKEEKLKPGEVYMIPQDDIFLTGFTGVYESHRSHEGTENYPSDEYPDAQYEEIIFGYPQFSDIFKDDVSIDLSAGIDPENPVLFILGPDGNDVTPTAYMRAASDEIIGNPMFPHEGWQPEELAKKALPTINYEVDENNHINLNLAWNNIVLYDNDGLKNTTADQVTLSGNFSIDDLSHNGGIEWHPDILHLDFLPQQIISKLSGTLNGKMDLNYNASMDTKALVKQLNSGFDNKKSIWGVSMSGVDPFKDKWVVCVIGLNLLPPSAVIGTSISGQAAASTLQPSLIVPVFMDINGNLSASLESSFNFNNSFTKGFNIQKNGYKGSYGSQSSNKSDHHYDIGSNYTLDIYDDNDIDYSWGINGKIEASFDTGVGIGLGTMVGGLCPAMVDGSIFYRMKGELEGKMDILPEFGLSGSAAIYSGIGVKANMAAKLLVQNGGLNASKKFEHMFFEKTASTAYIDGTVYASDEDDDASNNTKIEGASVTLTKDDTDEEWHATTNNEGYYKFESLPKGKYAIKVEKDGFDVYTDNTVVFEKSEYTKTVDVFLTSKPDTPDDPGATGVVSSIQPGNFLTFGSFNGNPILWQVVEKDGEKLKLFSYRSLFNGQFDADVNDHITQATMTTTVMEGNSNWHTSDIRQYLNSSQETVTYKDKLPNYSALPGFLTNFTAQEQAAFVETTHKSAVHRNTDKSKVDGGNRCLGSTDYMDFPDMNLQDVEYDQQVYKNTTEKVFLPDALDIYNAYKVDSASIYGDGNAYITRSPVYSYARLISNAYYFGMYYLYIHQNVHGGYASAEGTYGIRPMCVIQPDASLQVSGSGTQDNPYRIAF